MQRFTVLAAASLLTLSGAAGATPVTATANEAPGIEEGLYVGAGLIGASLNGSTAGALGGGLAQLYYETPHTALGGDLRIAIGGDETSGSSFQYVAVSLGGRWFTFAGDLTPFFGGGLVYSDLQFDDLNAGTYFRGGAAGLGGYAEAGLAAFRTDLSRLTVSLRADMPFFDVADGQTGETRYLMPVSLAATFAF